MLYAQRGALGALEAREVEWAGSRRLEKWPKGQVMKVWTRLAKNVHLILHSRKLLRILISGEL